MNGIWEIRGEPRPFVHSEVMCWVALDRALGLADLLNAEDRIADWKVTTEEIRTAAETRGWDADLGAFTQSFDNPDLDATAVLLPIVGFLPADDPRVLSSIDAVRDRLTDQRGLVHRYHSRSGVDGLDGQEGTFLLCTCWPAHALALAGRIEEGTEVFEHAASYADDVSLLAEEVDSSTGELYPPTRAGLAGLCLLLRPHEQLRGPKDSRRRIRKQRPERASPSTVEAPRTAERPIHRSYHRAIKAQPHATVPGYPTT